MKTKTPFLVNAAEMHRQHPDTFDVPSSEEIARLKKGDVVKVSDNRERFWVEIIERSENQFVGRVDSLRGDLNELIRFHADNIYDIYDAKFRER